MSEFHILVAIDEDDEAASLEPLIVKLASGENCRVSVVGIAPSLSRSLTNPRVVSLAKDAEGLMINTLRQRIDSLLEAIDAPGEAYLTAGRPADEIIKQAILSKADLVIKAADRPVGEKRPIFGSVEKKLIRKCPVPVWIVRTERSLLPERIAVAVDNLSMADNPAEAELLAGSLVSHAFTLAKRFGLDKVTVIHAWSAAGLAILEHPRARVSPDAVAEYMGEWEHVSREWLNSFVASVNNRFAGDGVRFEAHLVMGAARTAVCDAVENVGADVLVIGSANRSGVPGLFIGNTAEGIIDRLPSSAYVVKPEGFASMIGSAFTEQDEAAS